MAEPVVVSSHVEIKQLPEAPISKLDLLVFVDDTAATAAYRDAIAPLPRALAEQLDALAGGWRDVRIAVTSNDGRLRALPGSQASVIVDARTYDYVHWQNYTGTLADALGSLMTAGGVSSGPSQPFEAMRRALETSSSFLRDDAELAIVIITGADDASPWPIADYEQWVKSAIGAPWHRGFVPIGIYPKPSERLDAFFTAMWTLPSTAIDGDLRKAFIDLRRVDWGGWGLPCFESAPLFAEDHPDCVLSMQLDNELRTMPACEPAAIVERADSATVRSEPSPACWSLERDPLNCWQNGYAMQLTGYTLGHHPAFRFECTTQ